MDSNNRETNKNVWENIYHRQDVGMIYPDDVLVRITHRLLNQEKHKDILDLGFGSGANMIHFLRKGYNVSGVEISDSAIESMKVKLDALGLSAELSSNKGGKMPYADASFDVLISWQVLLYNDWNSFKFTIEDIERVVKPGGLVLVTIGAEGDYSHTHSKPLGNFLYESIVPGQEGAVVLVLPKENVEEYFEGRKNLMIGEYGYSFGERHAKHWIVCYEK